MPSPVQASAKASAYDGIGDNVRIGSQDDTGILARLGAGMGGVEIVRLQQRRQFNELNLRVVRRSSSSLSRPAPRHDGVSRHCPGLHIHGCIVVCDSAKRLQPTQSRLTAQPA